jgi:hypothetical protein
MQVDEYQHGHFLLLSQPANLCRYELAVRLLEQQDVEFVKAA